LLDEIDPVRFVADFVHDHASVDFHEFGVG
jgi:hypothetical protein